MAGLQSSGRTTSMRPVLHSKGVFSISRLYAHEGSAEAQPGDVEIATAPRELISSSSELSVAQAPLARSPAPSPGRGADGRRLFFATPRSLSYLDGTLPGDYGWDPLGLAAPSSQEDETMNLPWLSYAEVIHGRWAMVATAGALAPELLARAGVIPAETGLPWFVSGGLYSPGGGPAVPFFGSVPFQYWTDQYTLLWTTLVAMGFAEVRRWQDYRSPGSMKQQYFLGLEHVLGGSGSPPYPAGQFFNLANLGAKSDQEMFELKTKEVKHGRLAMVAWLGFMVQAQTTHRGPVDNILDHIAAPHTENLAARVGDFAVHATSAEKTPFLIWLLAGAVMCAVVSEGGSSSTRVEDQVKERK